MQLPIELIIKVSIALLISLSINVYQFSIWFYDLLTEEIPNKIEKFINKEK